MKTIFVLTISAVFLLVTATPLFSQWPSFSTGPIYLGHPIPIGPPIQVAQPVFYQQSQPMVTWNPSGTYQTMRPATVNYWAQQATTSNVPATIWQPSFGQPSQQPVAAYRPIYQHPSNTFSPQTIPNIGAYSNIYRNSEQENQIKQIQTRAADIEIKVDFLIQEVKRLKQP